MTPERPDLLTDARGNGELSSPPTPAATLTAAASSAPPVSAPAPSSGYELGVLNRHWYRRCLDNLERMLRDQKNPSAEELRGLSDRILTGLLTAVTGQAPDSDRLQFPADRAYYIPFEGDVAARFNFAKPFYQFPRARIHENLDDKLRGSLWSFFPWESDRYRIRIDADTSVSDGKTISFKEMIQVRDLFRSPDAGVEAHFQVTPESLTALKSAGVPETVLSRMEKLKDLDPTPEDPFLQELAKVVTVDDLQRYKTEFLSSARAAPLVKLRKSLLLREEQDALLKEVIADQARPAEVVEPAGPSPGRLDQAVKASLCALFENYRDTPGNAAVEYLLLNHLHVLRWLMTLLDKLRKAEDLDDGAAFSVALPQGQGSYQGCIKSFLRYYFYEEEGAPPGAADGAANAFVEDLRCYYLPPGKRPAGRTVPTAEKLAQSLQNRKGTPFVRWLTTMKSERASPDKWLPELKSFLERFEVDFVQADCETRLETELFASLDEDLLRAGQTDQSFVWVCPDFEKINSSLPVELAIRRPERVQSRSKTLIRALVSFYQHLDVACLTPRQDALESYWRTLQEAQRILEGKKVYSSFTDSRAGLTIPEEAIIGSSAELLSPRPQNIFLRVKVCDSLNEPVINGLFVFSADHDEVMFKQKDERLRKEDVSDLLAFAKVYFFTIRDYLRGLDRAREAFDIGNLNQVLYDQRLAELNQAMKRREETKRVQAQGLTHYPNWITFVYELLNGYASSLLEKPPDVAIETFGYDRLLLLPLANHFGSEAHDLPFYYFQGIYLERKESTVAHDHYSLLKPFQSPVDRIVPGKADRERFTLRTFQQVSHLEGREIERSQYLEKYYVGQEDGAKSFEGEAPEKPRSLVCKLVKPDRAGEPAPQQQGKSIHPAAASSGAPPETSSQRPPEDRGKDWACRVVKAFWVRTRTMHSLWRRFLIQLTEDYRRLRDEQKESGPGHEQQHWFWFRLSLLRLVLQQEKIKENESYLELKTKYDETLKLQFDDDRTIDVIALATQRSRELYRLIEGTQKRLRPLVDAFTRINFEKWKLDQQDPFVLEFLQELTDHVVNAPRVKEQGGEGETWYQPVLTRPQDSGVCFKLTAESLAALRNEGVADAVLSQLGKLKDQDLASEDAFLKELARVLSPEELQSRKSALLKCARWSIHRIAASKTDDRLPPYADVRAGKDNILMHLGVVHFRIGEGEKDLGQSDRDQRWVSLLVAVIRDFDPSRSVRGQGNDDIGEQIEKDRKDLTLFTKTVFQNVDKFVTNAVRQQQLRVLSTDINQIARNWYSTGIDLIIDRLQERLQSLVQTTGDNDLGRLRPEMMDQYIDSLLEVLLRTETRELNAPILLESFPFDRLLHIPLQPGPSESARLAYARTTIEGETWDRDPKQDASKRSSKDVYQQVRDRGRVWPTDRGQKKIAGSTFHFGHIPRGGPGAASLFEESRFRVTTEVLAALRSDGVPDAVLAPLETLKDLEVAAEEPFLKQLAKLMPAEELQQFKTALLNRTFVVKETPLAKTLRILCKDKEFDEFVRGLYEANTLQTLALAGLLHHLLRQWEQDHLRRQKERDRALAWEPALERVASRLWQAINDRIRSLERVSGSQAVLTRADLSPTVSFEFAEAVFDRPSTDVATLPFFRDFFRALEGEAEHVYGLATGKDLLKSVRSKVIYVYYSLAAPDRFTEGFQGDSRYRGLFCLIVDDASTDVKTEKSQDADREDIHTFIHNSVGSLKLVLDQQALHQQLLQPGVDQFLNGMLHRLKNELGYPVVALNEARKLLQVLLPGPASATVGPAANVAPGPRAADAMEHVPAHVKAEALEVVNTIDQAKATITGIENLFLELKGLSEIQRGHVPLQTFNSTWLGWLYVGKLAAVIVKAVESLPAGKKAVEAVAPGSETSLIDRVKKIGKVADEWLAAADARPESVERIPGQLLRLQDFLQQALIESVGLAENRKIEFHFSYQVFAEEPLRFIGSHLFIEAAHILVENAFQEMWRYAQLGLAENSETVGRLSVICRRSETTRGEVAVDLRNSSKPIDPQILLALNSDVPRPISAQKHSAGSGKKGGSGFGHYHARRLISDFCGGREWRRKLDVRVSFQDPDLAVVKLNLIEDVPQPPHELKEEGLLANIARVFTDVKAVFEQPQGTLDPTRHYYFPSHCDIRSLLHVVLGLLAADRQAKVARVCGEMANLVCGEIKLETKMLTTLLVEGAEQLLTTAAAPLRARCEELLRDLRNAAKLPPESAPGLCRLFDKWRSDSEVLEGLTAALESKPAAPPRKERIARLKRLIRLEDLRPEQLLADGQREDHRELFKTFRNSIKAEAYKEECRSFYETLDADADGKPTPSLKKVIGLFNNEVWSNRLECHPDRIVCYFCLADGSVSGKEGAPRTTQRVEDVELLKDFGQELGRTFVQYRQRLEDKACPGGSPIGELWFERHTPTEGVPDRVICLVLRVVQRTGSS